jgi:adenylate cyclase
VGDERHQAYIVIHGPGHDGTTLPLREGITSFGRLPSNDVILLGDLVSRHHSRITFFEGRATLQDLGSHNGSWVNNERVQSRVLKEGDNARVGNFRIAFHVGTADKARKGAGYDETTAAEQTSSQGGRLQASPSTSQSVLIREIEQARSGEAGGARALHLLYRASDALARAVDTESYLLDILSLALEQVSADLAAYTRVEADGHQIVCALGPDGQIANPQVSLSVVRWVTTKNFPITTDDIRSDLRFGGPPSAAAGPEAVMCVPVTSEDGVIGALYMARGSSPFADTDLDALSAIAHLSVVGIERAETRHGNRSDGEVLSRFFSPDVAELVGKANAPKLEPKTATVLTTDLQGFSSIMEKVSVEQVTDFLNRLIGPAEEIIHKNKGAIARVIGTQIVASFGAPFSHGNDAARAVASALEIRAIADALIKQRPNLGAKRLSAGIDSGWLVSGVVGSGTRLTYTIAGDTVTSAMRLEASAAPGAILIGEGTMTSVQQVFEVRKLGLTQVKGRTEPVRVYEVLGKRQARR